MSRSVIKRGETKSLAKGAFRLDLRDVSTHVEAAAAAARVEADRLLSDARAQARREVDRIREDARREGFADGLAAGHEEGRRQALDEARRKLATDQRMLIDTMNAIIRQFRERRDQLLLAARRDALALAIAIARRITDKVSQDSEMAPATAVDACREALGLIGRASEVRVRVHPEDLAALKQFLTRADLSAFGGDIDVIADDEIARGGAVAQTNDCRIDAAVSQRVERIADALLADWRERGEALGVGS